MQHKGWAGFESCTWQKLESACNVLVSSVRHVATVSVEELESTCELLCVLIHMYMYISKQVHRQLE